MVIEGLPEGARLSAGLNNGDGSWTLTPSQLAGLTVTPPADWSGTMALTMLAHSRETSNGSVKTTRETFEVHADATADAPVVSARDAAGREDEPIGLNLSAAPDRPGRFGDIVRGDLGNARGRLALARHAPAGRKLAGIAIGPAASRRDAAAELLRLLRPDPSRHKP